MDKIYDYIMEPLNAACRDKNYYNGICICRDRLAECIPYLNLNSYASGMMYLESLIDFKIYIKAGNYRSACNSLMDAISHCYAINAIVGTAENEYQTKLNGFCATNILFSLNEELENSNVHNSEKVSRTL